MKTDSVFFAKEGEKGLNETSAAHLCALATQVVAEDRAYLNNVSFVNCEVQIIGASISNPTAVGFNEAQLNELKVRMDRISRMNEFISWFSEARKALENLKSEVSSMDFKDYVRIKNIVLPEKPENEGIAYPTEQDVLNSMSIKEMETYLALQAKSAVYGKFIHPDNPFEAARENMHHISTKPHEIGGMGRDTVIRHFSHSVSPKLVDDYYLQLQKEYRATQQSLNHMKSDIKRQLHDMVLTWRKQREDADVKYRKDLDVYHAEMEKLHDDFKIYMENAEKALSKIKLAIPIKLESIIEMLNSL